MWGTCDGRLGMLPAAPPGPQAALLTRPLPPRPPGISEDSKVEAPAFTDAVRMYRQSKEQYGTWDMLCGNQSQVRAGPWAGGSLWGRAGSPTPPPFAGAE